MQLPFSLSRVGILAGVVGAAGALTFVAGSALESTPIAGSRSAQSSGVAPADVSGPCDEAEHADDPECAGVTPANPGTTPTTAAPPTDGPAPGAPSPGAAATGARSLPTVGGTVVYDANGNSVSLVSAVPASGWRVEVEQSSGREVELDFRSGSRRVQVNLEIEDGRVRERVRVRDDAAGTDVRAEDGTVVDGGNDGGNDDDGHDLGDDHGGRSGSDGSASGSSG
jgi:hypothetical protein